ncbi:MAG: NUDIX domain-containing protein [Parasporobacterium sp.]|nr:NUDIX domain-containing protein [Parasporobacterium sp.]
MEMWDIYDVNKQLTGRTMQRNDWHMQPGDYHLTVLGVIRRPDGRFLITQRVLTKSWAAGCWEVSGGGVQAGETSEEAVRREVLEETGIDVKDAEGGYVFSYRRDNPDEGDNYFVDIYRFEMDVAENDVVIQKSEANAFRFASAGEIAEIAARGEFLHYDSIKEIFC